MELDSLLAGRHAPQVVLLLFKAVVADELLYFIYIIAPVFEIKILTWSCRKFSSTFDLL